jgi:hypothetical protein
MKISRNELKSLIKECLVEIFAETATISESRSQKQQPMHRKPLIEKSLAVPNRVHSSKFQHVNTSHSNMHNVVSSVASGNAILESILSDTAQNTLPAMLAAGDSMEPAGHDVSGPTFKEHFSGDPSDIFGESSMNWEKLAFSGKKQ